MPDAQETAILAEFLEGPEDGGGTLRLKETSSIV